MSRVRPGRFIFLSGWGTNSVARLSSNGIDWPSNRLDTAYGGVGYDQGRFVLVGNRHLSASDNDGTTGKVFWGVPTPTLAARQWHSRVSGAGNTPPVMVYCVRRSGTERLPRSVPLREKYRTPTVRGQGARAPRPHHGALTSPRIPAWRNLSKRGGGGGVERLEADRPKQVDQHPIQANLRLTWTSRFLTTPCVVRIG